VGARAGAFVVAAKSNDEVHAARPGAAGLGRLGLEGDAARELRHRAEPEKKMVQGLRAQAP
jgi:hypothetical protein